MGRSRDVEVKFMRDESWSEEGQLDVGHRIETRSIPLDPHLGSNGHVHE